MKIRRAVGISILAYLASLAIGTIVAVVAGIDLAETQAIPPLLWYTGAVVSIIFAVLFARWYFRGDGVLSGAGEGLRFGFVMIATGFVLDFVTFLPLLTHDDPWGSILTYYTDPLFWGTVGLVLVATTLTGRQIASRTA